MQPAAVRRVLVLGAGTSGVEIAVQCARFGYAVTVFDIEPRQLESCRRRGRELLQAMAAGGAMEATKPDAVLDRILLTADAEQAVDQADVVSESVSENLKVKREVLADFSRRCGPETVFATNTSYFVPSMLAKALARPENFAALHFHVPVWYANVADIMPHPGTSTETVEFLQQFALSIGQVPILSRRESHGYVFNTMLRDLLMAAVGLAARDVASVEDIDRAWMGVTKMGLGPFGMIDNIGLDTVHDIISFWGQAYRDPQAKKNAEFLRAQIEAGRLGVKNGQGFYTYPQPKFRDAGFLAVDEPAPAAEKTPATWAKEEEPRGRSVEMVAQRWTLRLAGSPTWEREAGATGGLPASTGKAATPKASEPRFSGAVLLLGENPTATVLATELTRAGVRVDAVPLAGSLEETLAWVDQLLAASAWAFPHLFLLSALEAASARGAGDSSRYASHLVLPYFVCQRWFAQAIKTGSLSQATLVVATALGGDFGLRAPVRVPEGGGLAGLAKSVFMEGIAHGAVGPVTTVVDLPSGIAPERAAGWLLDELGRAQSQVQSTMPVEQELFERFSQLEVGYLDNKRHVLRLQPAESGESQSVAIEPGSTWVVTGGARGITAIVARELAARFQLRLHLVGTTPLPETDYSTWGTERLAGLKRDVMKQAYAAGEKPNVAWGRIERAVEAQRNLAELAERGIAAEYHACDLGNREAVAALLEDVRRQDGPIRGILHGAGIEISGRFEAKTDDMLAKTLRPKYLGTRALMELTGVDPLRWFIAFGSLSGRFGGVGQTDYAMANEVLAKLVAWHADRRPECRSLVFHWPGWDRVGMAARPASRASLGRIEHRLVQPEEGVAHLLAQLASPSAAREVVVVNRAEVPPQLRTAE